MSHANPIPPKLRTLGLATLYALALAACGGGGGGGRTLDGISLGAAQAYAVVGVQQKLTATGHYSDGTTAALGAGLAWGSSDPTVVSVDDSGNLAPWAKGTARITVTDQATGVSGQADVTARAAVTLAAGKSLPAAGRVELTDALFRITGLVPGGMYSPAVFDMTDDVDIAVYSDVSLEPGTRLCASGRVGTVAETCVAPANATGELWVVVNGEWTRSGATFDLDVPAAEPVSPAATLAFPAAFPYAGAVGATRQYLRVTGLTPGATYQALLSDLTADLDLAVYADAFRYRLLCESVQAGTTDDSCTVAASDSGELILEIDGETSPEGGPYSLAFTAQ